MPLEAGLVVVVAVVPPLLVVQRGVLRVSEGASTGDWGAFQVNIRWLFGA